MPKRERKKIAVIVFSPVFFSFDIKHTYLDESNLIGNVESVNFWCELDVCLLLSIRSVGCRKRE